MIYVARLKKVACEKCGKEKLYIIAIWFSADDKGKEEREEYLQLPSSDAEGTMADILLPNGNKWECFVGYQAHGRRGAKKNRGQTRYCPMGSKPPQDPRLLQDLAIEIAKELAGPTPKERAEQKKNERKRKSMEGARKSMEKAARNGKAKKKAPHVRPEDCPDRKRHKHALVDIFAIAASEGQALLRAFAQ